MHECTAVNEILLANMPVGKICYVTIIFSPVSFLCIGIVHEDSA